MKYSLLVILLSSQSLLSPGWTTPGRAPVSANRLLAAPATDTAAAQRAKVVAAMQALYQIAYRPPAEEAKKTVLSVTCRHDRLQLTYLAGAHKQSVSFDVGQLQPAWRLDTTRRGEQRAFVYDQRTGADLFCWLEKKADAAVLKQDLLYLQTLLRHR